MRFWLAEGLAFYLTHTCERSKARYGWKLKSQKGEGRVLFSHYHVCGGSTTKMHDLDPMLGRRT